MDYDSMPAGREMDALVAEKVTGWDGYHDVDQDTWYSWCRNCGELGEDDDIGHWEPGMDQPKGCKVPPPYSTSISAAWEVVEHFRQRQWKVELVGHEWYDGGEWECVLLDALNDERGKASDIQHYKANQYGWDEPSAPLAICRAALKATPSPDGEREE